ncbi:MAG TPA: GNAT family N-acetyltransferase [Acidimicrobiales bacterium]
MELIDLPDFGPDDFAKMVDGEADPFATADLDIEWREKTGHVGLTDKGRLIGHAGWVAIQVATPAGQSTDVVGLGGVMLHRDFRGRGAGRQVVLAAMARMAELGGSIGMLFCLPQRLRFYQDLGWFRIDQAVTADQPTGSILMPMVTCWTPLVEGATLPATDLHVQGLPF